MNKCKKCGTEFEGKFCPECGTPWLNEEEKICPKCKAVLKASAKFCSECGYSFEKPQPAKQDRQLTGGTKKLYAAVCILPAVLLALFSVLLFFLYLTPVAVMPGGNFMGVKIPDTSYGNVYETSNYEGMSFTGSMTALVVCAALALVLAFVISISFAFYKMRDKRFTVVGRKIFLRNILTAIGYVLFFVLFLVSCIMMGQIANDDGGLGLMKAGIAPILVLVFTLVGILVSLLCALAGVYLRKKYPALVAETEKKIAAKKPTKLETWIKRHKVWTGVITAAVIAGIVVGVAVPVGLANRYNGTYYAYNGETEEYNMEKFYKLSGDVWTDEEGERGKITFDGEKVTLSRNLSEGGDILEGLSGEMEGTINEGILKIGETVYAKKGHEHKPKEGECICGTHFSVGLGYKKVDGGWAVTGIGTCKDTDIVICAWHENKRVIEIGEKAFYDRKLTRIVIPNSVTTIGEQAFSRCNGLTSVTIGSGVTSIGSYAFFSCSGLTSITIPSGVTSIGSYAFFSCSGLTSITIPIGVTSIGERTFRGCSGLTSITIPDSVTEIGNCAFDGCSGLTSITIPDGVTSIGEAVFYGCSGLESVTIGRGVTKIKYRMFEDCSGLTSVTIPDGVTSIGDDAFRHCSGLTEIQFNGIVEEWQAINKETSWDSFTGDYTVTCTDGTVDKYGNVTYFNA